MPLNPKQQAQFNTVCARIADGMSLKAACASKDMPRRQTILDWLKRDGEGNLSTIYARAREAMADKLADEVMEIADSEGLAPEDKRIMVDARKWVAAKQRPRKYGDKLALGGADDLPAIKQETTEKADSFTAGIAGLVGRADKATRH